MRIGVLALQGGFEAHARLLRASGFEVSEIRCRDHLNEKIEGLVLPGGESGVHVRLLERFGMWNELDSLVSTGIPVLATCAGVILACRSVRPQQRSFGWVPVTVERNAYGDQRFSREEIVESVRPKLRLIFIRAPKIVDVPRGVNIHLYSAASPILVSYRSTLLATFHPELSGDGRFYEAWFRQKTLSNLFLSAK